MIEEILLALFSGGHCLITGAPGLAKTTQTSLQLFPQIGLTSRCVSHNLIPTGNEVINDQGSQTIDGTTYNWNFNPDHQPNFREFFYGTVQLAGESQDFDGNGSYVRFQAGGGSFNEPGSDVR